MTTTAATLLERLRALDDLLVNDRRFVYDRRLELGPPTDRDALESVERAARIEVPEPWRTLLVHHTARGGFCFHAHEDARVELDVGWGGGDGGFELLDAHAMREHRDRIVEFDPKASELAFLPLVKDPSAATWLCVIGTPRGHRIALVSHEEPVADAERWPVEGFFDDWSRAGFPVDSRWEDQSEPIVALFATRFGGAGEQVS